MQGQGPLVTSQANAGKGVGDNGGMQIGPYKIEPALVVAPMAGVTDRPFRQLCKRLGAGLAVSEMTASDPALWNTEKSRTRLDHEGEVAPIDVQIAGYDPQMMAAAARFNVEHGAQIIDINMGCPAKKVCKRDAGSALMRDEKLVGEILRAVVAAVDVPVTLKTRTGWARANKNGPVIARIAEDAGIAALAIHGRTRQDKYLGSAEYDTIAAIKASVSIPVMANGDITSPEQARRVLEYTGADALMIGRGAQGNPWIFAEIEHFLRTGEHRPPPPAEEVCAVMLEHLDALHHLYGERRGVRIARKHIGWYCENRPGAAAFREQVMAVDEASHQRDAVEAYFSSPAVAAAA